jgi:large conductance mechanosensitive channel
MSLLKEFKEFAMKGNVIDLAVGVVIGTAFGKIITSLVSDIIMPIVGFLTAGVDVKGLAYRFMVPGTETAVELKWGMFAQATLDFVIVAFAIFVFVKVLTKAMPKKKTEAAPAGPTDVELLTEIRDLLKKKA